MRELVRTILNYELELSQFLEWKLNNLDVRNMNPGKLSDISTGVIAPVAMQAQAALVNIGDLKALTTTVRTSLVAAINELNAGDVTQAEFDALVLRVTAVEHVVAALTARVTVNEGAIAVLNARVTALEK